MTRTTMSVTTNAPRRLNQNRDEMTTHSSDSTSTVPSVFARRSAQSAIANSTREEFMQLEFDRSKIHGRQRETRVLETIIKSMTPRKRKDSSGSTQQTRNTSTANNETTNNASDQQEKGQSRIVVTAASRAKREKHVVLISGYSGTGKSVLAHSIRPVVENEMGGTFVTGKFDQCLGVVESGSVNGSHRQEGQLHQQQQPYTAFRMICDGLVRKIVALKLAAYGTPARRLFEELKDQLMMELGTELMDLIQVFPSLDALISTTAYHDNSFGDSSGGINMFETTQSDASEPFHDNFLGSSSSEARFRFKFIFGVLLRIIASVLSPLVLVIDDLQWADMASLDLLESLLTNPEIENFMVVGIYRSNEVYDTHIVSKTLRDIHSAARESTGSLHIVELEVGNLDIDAIHEMLASLLSTNDKDKVGSLAEICFKKTAGNPFYLTHFISRLHEMRMLSYDNEMMEWTWDGQTIESYTQATDNVVDLLRQSMTSLPPDHQTLLRFASFLGSTFEVRPIFALWKDFRKKSNIRRQRKTMKTQRLETTMTATTHAPEQNTNRKIEENYPEGDQDDSSHFTAALESCQNAGYWEQAEGEQTYRWVHDKLQEAAMDLVARKERRDFSQYVAEVLASQLSDKELKAMIFVLVDRFNEGKRPMTRSKRIDLARLNLQAAEKAVSYSAFESAASYCKHGIQMLPLDCWENDYDLSLQLYSLGAENEGLLGHVHLMEEYCKEVLAQKEVVVGAVGSSNGFSSNVLESENGRRRGGVRDKFRVYNIMMFSISNRKLPKEALKLCVSVLGEYGVRFPKTSVGIVCRIGIGIAKIKAGLNSTRTREAIEKLPIMRDPIRIEQMCLLDKMATYCFASNSDLFPLVAFKLLDLTFQYGYCKFSPLGFALIGVILAGVLGDLSGGRKYAEHALMLLSKLSPPLLREVESRTMFVVYSCNLHWTESLRSTLQPALRGYEAGMHCGDTESAMFILYYYLLTAFTCGVKLDAIEGDCRVYSVQMKKLKHEVTCLECKILWQTVLNLMGQSQIKTRLTGEALKEDICREEVKSNPEMNAFFEAFKLILCSFFSNYKNAAEYAYVKGENLQQTVPGSPLTPMDAFHRCLSLMAMARILQEKRSGTCGTRRSGEESKYVKSAKKILVKIKNWTKQGNHQSRHYEPLLEAEFAAYQGKSQCAVVERYEMAVEMAAEDGYIQDSALANERYGLYLLSQRDHRNDGIPTESNDGNLPVKECSKEEIIGISKEEWNGTQTKSAGFARLKESIRCYREWGASGKANALEENIFR